MFGNFDYLKDFKGFVDGGSVILPALAGDDPTAVVRLPDQPCKFVQLHNWNTLDDISFTAKGGAGAAGVEDDLQEIFWGVNGKFVGQLFQGRSTEIMPIANLNQIIVRTRPLLAGKVYYTWFW